MAATSVCFLLWTNKTRQAGASYDTIHAIGLKQINCSPLRSVRWRCGSLPSAATVTGLLGQASLLSLGTLL